MPPRESRGSKNCPAWTHHFPRAAAVDSWRTLATAGTTGRQRRGRPGLSSVPNIGPKLAKRIHDELSIETLAELRLRLGMDGCDACGGLVKKEFEPFANHSWPAVNHPEIAQGQEKSFDRQDDLTSEVPVEELLDVDDEYRFKAAQGKLPRVARADSIQQRSSTRILHTDRGQRHYTALFSNTEHAHTMGTTHDWASFISKTTIIASTGPSTVITSQFGQLKVAASYVAATQWAEIYVERTA